MRDEGSPAKSLRRRGSNEDEGGYRDEEKDMKSWIQMKTCRGLSAFVTGLILSVCADAAMPLELRNPHHQWTASFDGRGFTVLPDHAAWIWGTELQGYGFPETPVDVSGHAPAVSHETDRVHYDWNADLHEWFVNDERGLEQGWTLQRRPPGGSPGDPLYLDLRVRGGLNQQVMKDDARYLGSDGQEVLSFNGLKAWDADGVVLPVQFESVPDRPDVLRIAVAEAGARYPITVDPLVREAFFKPPTSQSNQYLYGEVAKLDGDTIAVLSPEFLHIYGFNSNSLSWSLVFSKSRQELASLVGTPFIVFSYNNPPDMSLDGNDLMVTATTIATGSDPALHSHSVLHFQRVNGVWQFQSRIKPQTTPDRTPIIGYSFVNSHHRISLSGDTMAVGNVMEKGKSRGINGDEGNESYDMEGTLPYEHVSVLGAVYVMTRSNSNSWERQAYIKSPDPALAFGSQVELSGNRLAVTERDPDQPSVTRVRLYSRSGTTWSLDQTLTVAGGVVGLALESNTLAVARSQSTVESSQLPGGSTNDVLFYTNTGSSWTQQGIHHFPWGVSYPGYWGDKRSNLDISGDLITYTTTPSNGFSSVSNSLVCAVFRRDGGSWKLLELAGVPGGFYQSMDQGRILFADPGNSSAAIGINGGNQNSTNRPNSGAVHLYQAPIVQVVDMEAVQSAQDLSNSVPLIAGKRTVVRVYVRSVEEYFGTVRGRLHGTATDGTTLPGSPVTNLVDEFGSPSIGVFTNACSCRDGLFCSLNFDLPPAWLQGTNTIRVELLDGLQENREPAGVGETANDGMWTLRFRRMPALPLHIVPVRLRSGASIIEPPSVRELGLHASFMQAIYPINNLAWDVTTALPYNAAAITDELSLGDLLAAIGRWRGMADYPAGDLFYGSFKLNRNVGGLAEYVGGRISSGRYVRENPSLMVHEVGHCLGREHTTSGATFGFGQCNYPTNRVGFQGPCGSCGEDAQFPYFVSRESDPSKFIAALGPTNMGYRSEVVGMNLSLSGPSVNYWNIYADFMSYCHLVGYPRWISKFTYEGIMTNIASRFGARGFAPLGRARQSQTIMSSHATPVPYLVIAGFIKVDDSEASLLPVLRVDRTQAIDPPSSGLYTLETQNNLGVMLASYDFDPSEGTEVPLVDRPFTLVVPDDPDIRRIVVKRNGVVLTEMAASQNPPVVMLLSPNGGEVFTGAEIPASWAGSDDDGDALTYSLLYSRDDGVTWAPVALDVGSETEMIDRTFLPGSTNARLRVIVSDGFWTAFDDSDDIFISAGHAPEIVKLDEVPGEELVRGSGMYLEAMVYDVEDGLLPGSNIVWGSDIQGILHTGTVVNSELAGLNLGLHQVQIVATDSDGHSVTGSTPVRVVPFTPAIVEKAEKHTGNLVRLSGTSAEDTEMLIERSTDFTTWTPVLTTYQFTVDFDLVTDGIETNEELGVFRAASRYRPPQIVEQSGATTSVFVNQAVVLYVEAFAEKPISYQWYFEGDPIPEATNTTHILTNVSLSAAGNYWVVMSNEGGTTTGATIFVDVQPSDDLFSAPTVITNFPALVEAVNSGYTLEPDEPLPTASASVGASVWFTWTAPSNTPVIIQTCESELDTVLAVWTGETLTSLVEVASNDEGASCSFDGSRVEFIATSGTTYRISVYGVNGESGLIIMSMYDQDPPPPPPSNDNFADAITLSGFGGAFSMSNNLATLEVDEPLPDNGLTLGASVWYTWTSPTNGLVRLNTCSIPFGFDSVLAVWTGATLQTLGLVGYNDDFCTARSQFDFVAVSGTVYRIAIYGKDGGEGAYDLGMQKLPDPPPNDAFATPMVITNFPSTNLATNAGATIEPGDPLDGFFASVWFQWTSPVTTNVTVQTCGSFFTTYVRVLTGDTLGSLTLVADNSPSCFNRSVLNFAATNGVTYRIGVARIGTSTQSSITLTIRNAP